jgi:hypothetical protein
MIMMLISQNVNIIIVICGRAGGARGAVGKPTCSKYRVKTGCTPPSAEAEIKKLRAKGRAREADG